MAMPNAPLPAPRLTGVVWRVGSALAGAGDRATLMMFMYPTDAGWEHAYGPAGGLLNTGIGMFTDALLQEAFDKSWFVIDVKNDWQTIFGEG